MTGSKPHTTTTDTTSTSTPDPRSTNTPPTSSTSTNRAASPPVTNATGNTRSPMWITYANPVDKSTENH